MADTTTPEINVNRNGFAETRCNAVLIPDIKKIPTNMIIANVLK